MFISERVVLLDAKTICYLFLFHRTGDMGGAQEGETDGFVTESEEMEIIDDTLEEKSKKFLLTAKNVRSIVHVRIHFIVFPSLLTF